jgi:hypothetical protein
MHVYCWYPLADHHDEASVQEDDEKVFPVDAASILSHPWSNVVGSGSGFEIPRIKGPDLKGWEFWDVVLGPRFFHSFFLSFLGWCCCFAGDHAFAVSCVQQQQHRRLHQLLARSLKLLSFDSLLTFKVSITHVSNPSSRRNKFDFFLWRFGCFLRIFRF